MTTNPRDTPDLPPVPDPYGPGLIRLTAHRGSGKWRKRHKGKDHYFGNLSDPRGAITEYIRRWPEITNPSERPTSAIRLFDGFEAFLLEGRRRLERGDMTDGRLRSYTNTLSKVANHFGSARPIEEISPLEWSEAMHECFGRSAPTTRNIRIQEVRTTLTWIARNMGLKTTAGDAIRPVPMRVRRRHERLKGPQLITPGQIRKLLKVCRSTEELGNTDTAITEVSILLAINAGMRQADIAQLTPHAYRRDQVATGGIRGWLDEPRAKTESPRRIPLWAETADALDRVLADRRHPELLLVSENGSQLVRGSTDLIAKRFARLRARAWKNPGSRHRSISLDRFRKTFVTVAKKARVDPPDMAPNARRLIAGHTTDDIHEAYNQDVPDSAMRQIVLHVRRWLYRLPDDHA